MRRLRSSIPDGISVMTDLWKDHLMSAALILGALVAGSYLVPVLLSF